MMYSDSLSASVIAGKLNEEEARREWIELRLKEEEGYNRERSEMLTRKTIYHQTTAPTSTQCHTVNGYTNCTSF